MDGGASRGGGVVAPPTGADGLQFFTPPTGTPQPGNFPGPPQPMQSQQQPGSFQQPAQQPFACAQSAAGLMQPGFFPSVQSNTSYDDIENEPPLLEELGINVEHIILRMKGIMFFKRLEDDVLRDADLSGPIAIILALAMCLLLAGKMQFGYVYGFGLSGCVGVWMLMNVMSQSGGIDLYGTTSILGYGLLPIVFVALTGVFLSLKGTAGLLISAVCIFWATAASSRFFATGIVMAQQRWLVAYPVGLFYVCFTLLAVF